MMNGQVVHALEHRKKALMKMCVDRLIPTTEFRFRAEQCDLLICRELNKPFQTFLR